MTGLDCPDWRALRAARSALGSARCATSPRAESVEREWLTALDHHRSCWHCLDAALAAEPLLVFARLAPPKLEADEAERMRERVAVARRLERHRSQHRLRSGGFPRPGNLATIAAAAAFILIVTALGPRVGPQGEAAIESAIAVASTGSSEARRLVTEQLGMLPLVEGATEISMLVGGDSYDWVQVSLGR